MQHPSPIPDYETPFTITGHRPGKFIPYGPSEIQTWIRTQTRASLLEILARFPSPVMLNGLAIGFDQWSAEEAFEVGLPVIGVMPFRGQESRWPAASQQRYREVLLRCVAVVVLHEEAPLTNGDAVRLLHGRNTWMAERGKFGLACWDGSRGGTSHCIQELASRGKSIVVIDPKMRTVLPITSQPV